MKVKTIGDTFDPSEWNKRAPHPMQLWQWGGAREKMGIDVYRLGEFKGGKLESVYQVTFHKIPKTPFTVGYLPRSVIPSREVLEKIVKEGSRKNCIFIKIEPYVPNTKYQIPNTKCQIQESSHTLFPKWTQIVDIKKSEDDLLANMKSKTRYNIRLARKKGVDVRAMTNSKGIDIFVDLYFQTCKRQGYYGHNREYHKILFQALKEKIAHILVAFYKKKPLAAYEIFICNRIAYYPYGGSVLKYRNLMASNLLMWEAIRFAKDKGAEKFDMWGSLAPGYKLSDRWAGFTRFKEGYGGEFVEFIGSYDIVVNPFVYRIYNILYPIRAKFLL